MLATLGVRRGSQFPRCGNTQRNENPLEVTESEWQGCDLKNSDLKSLASQHPSPRGSSSGGLDLTGCFSAPPPGPHLQAAFSPPDRAASSAESPPQTHKILEQERQTHHFFPPIQFLLAFSSLNVLLFDLPAKLGKCRPLQASLHPPIFFCAAKLRKSKKNHFLSGSGAWLVLTKGPRG